MQAAPWSQPVAHADAADALWEVSRTLALSQNSDGGFGYYPGKRSRVEATAWVALTAQPQAPKALSWLASVQGEDGWLRDDSRAAVNYAFNALALLAFLTNRETLPRAERVGTGLLQAKGQAYGPSPVVRQDNSLQAWPWVENTISWVEPTSYGALALKRARQVGALGSSIEAVRTRIEVGERLLQDRACVSGGWNYGNAHVFGQDLLAHGPTTAVALLALQDRASQAFVQAGVRFLSRQAEIERSGFALALSSLCLRVFGQSAASLDPLILEQIPTSIGMANTVTLAALSVVLSTAPGALAPFRVTG